MDFNIIRDKLVIRMMNQERKKDFLVGVAHRRVLDLAAVYYLMADPSDQKSHIMPVTWEMMESWQVAEDELFAVAMENMNENMCIRMKNIITTMIEMIESSGGLEEMSDIVNDMLEVQSAESKREQMFVITDRSRMNGSVALLISDRLRDYSEILERDLVIIPSSVHELICIRDSKNFDYDSLRKVVEDVNSSMIKPEEVLSDNIYRYSYMRDELEIIK